VRPPASGTSTISEADTWPEREDVKLIVLKSGVTDKHRIVERFRRNLQHILAGDSRAISGGTSV